MTNRLNISVPATLTVLAGMPGLSSLGTAGLGQGITLSGAGAADTIALKIIAAATAATIGVLGAGGATVVSTGNTLSLTGTQAQINLALAGLELTEPASVSSDVLSLSATDTAAVAASSAFAVNVAALTGPAFVAPPQAVTLRPNSLSTLSGLLLSDPIAAGLAAMGQGSAETLSLTLSVAEGVLLLPGISAMSGVTAAGLGTGTIMLSLTANQLGQLNTLLAGLAFAGPAGGQLLDYALWNAAGVLPRTVTKGSIVLDVLGTAAAPGVFAAGTQTLFTGGTAFSGTLAVTATDSVYGTLSGGAAAIAPGAALEVPDGAMTLSGGSSDYGTLSAEFLTLSGTMLMGGEASFANEITLLAGAQLELSNGLTVYGTANNSYDVGLTLDAGAVVEGSGTLLAGNFSQGAVVDGGTLLALQGDTLEVDAGWITASTLEAGGGGVMVLGPVSPLYGVFTTTPVTIAQGVILDFLQPGAQGVSGGYANTLGGAGGAFVIGGPQYFSGTIVNFGIGDALIFPDLSNLSIYNIGASTFQMAGLDSSGDTVTYTIHASIASGLSPAVDKDAQGDVEVYMRSTAGLVTQGAPVVATAGFGQPLLGVAISVPSSNTQGLTLTLTAEHGSLSSGGAAPASSIIMSAANAVALNSEIDAVSYFTSGTVDTVLFSSNAGLLAGLQGNVYITPGGAGTVSGNSGLGASVAEMVTFSVAAGIPQIIQAMAVGGLDVGGNTEFESIVHASGISGTALIVDSGSQAIFDVAAPVSLGGDVTLGDTGGAGTLMLITDSFSVTGNVTLAQAAAAAGSVADILGALSASGALDAGISAAATVFVEGRLTAGALSLGAAGTLQALGTAAAVLGAITNSGFLLLAGTAQAVASSYQGGGTLDLGGTSTLAVAGAVGSTGVISIGSGGVLTGAGFTAASGSVYDAGLIAAASVLSAATIILAGGTLKAGTITLGSTLAGTLGSTLAGSGVVEAHSIAASGVVAAQAGRLLLTGNVSGTATLEIGMGAILELGGTIGGAPVVFAGTAAELVLDDAAAGNFAVMQMQSSDAIDLIGIAPSLVSIGTGGAGTILTSQGSVASLFTLTELNTAQAAITVSPDGAGGALLTAGGVLPCFARGTGILGPNGYRPVESLRPNDPVITISGERRPVRWIGWRTLDLSTDAAHPVLILPDAFGPGRPHKKLRLSPSHCIYTGGVLIPVTHLVNGATILREKTAQAVTYFHIELDRHHIVLADGLECESYFDDGNRAAMYQELGRRSPARRMYAQVVTSGARLASVRRALHAQALAAGYEAQYRAHLRGVAAGHSAVAEITLAGERRVARFAFPIPVRELVLLSTTAAPADTDPDSEDRRELGICLGKTRGVRLGGGWQPRAAGDAGTWMGAYGTLGFTQARREISLPLAAVAQSWYRWPVDVRRAGG